MKNRTLLTLLGLGVLLASCNSSRYAYNDGFEDDELYYSSTDPEEYDLSAYEVEENNSDNYDYYGDDDYYSEENGEYDDGGDTYITNNNYGNSNGWNSNPYNSNPYYSYPSYGYNNYGYNNYGYNNYGSGWNFGWNSLSGWNLGYNWGWGHQYYNPYSSWGYNYYNPWNSAYYGSCWNNPYYGGYSPYYNYGYGYGSGYSNGYYNNDYTFNGSNQFFGHSSSLSSNSSINSQYSQGTILTQATERNIALAEAPQSQNSLKPQIDNPVVNPGNTKPELLASTIVEKPQIITSRTDVPKVTGKPASDNHESNSRLGGDYQWKPNSNTQERSNHRKPVSPTTRTKPHAGWSSSPQRTNPSYNRDKGQHNDSWNQRNNGRSNYGSSNSNSRENNTPSYNNRNSSRSSGNSRSSGSTRSSGSRSSSSSSSSGRR